MSIINQNMFSKLLRTAVPILFIAFSGSSAQVFRGYYPDGTLLERTDRNAETQQTKRYFPDGHIEMIAEYRNDRLDGTVREYYANGFLKTSIPYSRGRRDGIGRWYWDNGVLMAKIGYKNNAETGEVRFYDSYGRPSKRTPLPSSIVPSRPLY